MGIITKIEDQKNKKRFNIFVDDAFFCGLLKEVAVVARLKVGKEISEEELYKLIFDSEVKMAFEKASVYLGTREHSKKELFDKLLKKGYEKPVIEETISKLEEYHYVDDELFAKHFAEQNIKYSAAVIEGKLRQKGIDNEIIKAVIENIDDGKEYELCKKQTRKLISQKGLDNPKNKDKIMASLIRKGFKINDIKKALNEFCFDNDEFYE